MVLLDRVDSWNENEITCATMSHLRSDNPLRRGASLPVLCGIEYGAQAMAVHGALVTQGGARRGMLASLRNVQCHVDRLDMNPGELMVEAQAVFGGTDRFIYTFTLRDAASLFLTGQAAVFLT